MTAIIPIPFEQIEADLGRTFASWSGQLDSFAANIRAVLAGYDREPIVFAELPPLAPERLDAEQQARDERRRRAAVLAPLGQPGGWVPLPPAEADAKVAEVRDALKRVGKAVDAKQRWRRFTSAVGDALAWAGRA